MESPNVDDAKVRALPVAARLFVVACWLALGYFASTARFSGEHTGPLLVRLIHALGFPDGDMSVLNFALRKTAHLCEYAGLAAIVVWVIAGVRIAGVRRHWFWIALATVALVGALDEFHQSFEPGRDSSLRDVVIDVCGALIFLVPLAVWRRRRGEERREKGECED